ncbi:phosphate/phosphite/phosphonate ABC transporter substrate-binding protein [Marivita hallyeonensis]|uniref:ABC transporter, phosphonate, substrate-binding protein n=1 Tax=Marivita hallyeonensis TaxID=996342 RepID=A0A1M5W8A6_9RHOB|nr:PhnD/SsuA/transferrin family substrate-binding protein [Marivita hallyeonensis]SHH83701.1 ABC transporter, phosphonate, substrate-binding protein [Marivita hallyeonensis]
MTIASLPMYWRAENAEMWRAFWSVLQDCAAEEGIALPNLTPPNDLPSDLYAHWTAPDLALSMTCGLPFRTALKGKVQYIGTLDFNLDCPAGHYYSCVIAGSDSNVMTRTGNLRLAYNAADSQSGWAVSQSERPFARPPRFSGFLETGSHATSLAAVAEGRADIAYIDAVTWRLLERFDPRAQQVHVLGHTDATPGLPLIAAKGVDPAPLRSALGAATTGFTPEDPYLMGGPMAFCVLEEAQYHTLPNPAPPPA